MDGNNNDDVGELKQKREQYSTEIRRQKREEKFKKQRQMDDLPENDKELQLDNIDIFKTQDSETQNVHNEVISQLNAYRDKLFTIENDLAYLIEYVNSADVIKMHVGVYGIRKILSKNEPPIQIIIDHDLVSPLINYMKKQEYPRLQVEAAWALTNIASGTRMQTQTIIDKGGLRLFVDSILSSNLDLVEQCLWAIGNISADSTHLRDMLNTMGAVENFLQVHEKVQFHKERYASWIWSLSNCCRGMPAPSLDKVIKATPYFMNAIHNENYSIEILNDSSWALCNIVITLNASENTLYGQEIVNHPCFSKILKILNNNQLVNIQVPLCKLIGNLAYMDDSNTVTMFEKYDMIETFNNLFKHESLQMIREVSWSLSNVVTGSEEVVHKLVSNDQLMNSIFKYVKLVNVPNIQREIYWTLSNMCRKASIQSLTVLINAGLFEVYAEKLTISNNQDVEVLIQIIKSIKKILKKGKLAQTNIFYEKFDSMSGFEMIAELQEHPNSNIYKICVKIIKGFCELEEEF